MKRRTFLAGGAVLLSTAAVAHAQRGRTPVRIGVLGISTVPAYEEVFRRALREHGYVIGDNAVVEWRWSEGNPERLAGYANELVQQKADVIVTISNPATQATMAATRTIPIIMASAGSPEHRGFVASLARPGGNVTGLTIDPGAEIVGKMLELFKQSVPKASHVALILSTGALEHLWRTHAESAARALSLSVHHVVIRDSGSLSGGLAELTRTHVDGLIR